MNKIDYSMSLGNPTPNISIIQKVSLAIGFTGLFILLIGIFNISLPLSTTFFTLGVTLLFAGVILYARDLYIHHSEGIKNNYVFTKAISSRGLWGWIVAVVLTVFYIILYFYPRYLGLGLDGKPNTGVVALFDPLSFLLKGQAASQWFVYGTLYTVAILAFGYKFILKYRHNRYQVLRTISVMFFQLGFAFLIPEIMSGLNNVPNKAIPYYDLKNMWPLNYYLFYDWNINALIDAGTIGKAMLVFGVLSIFVISPILTYRYGKRWYCSWVCGCGGLAETAGDAFRQLSSKKLNAWKLERWTIHTVLVFAVLMTIATVYTYLNNNPSSIVTKSQFVWAVALFLTGVLLFLLFFKRRAFDKDARYTAISLFLVIVGSLLINYFSGEKNLFFFSDYKLQKAYGFAIGSVFSGVIGTGFYPILGNRVWCRFGCPMAAILGIQQRLFSKFRITTNGGQCISCGNCSTYCEMGIDVRAYAQKGENIVRASCVGCGVCSAVCPRGVLKLENGSEKGRINPNEILLGNNPDLMGLINRTY